MSSHRYCEIFKNTHFQEHVLYLEYWIFFIFYFFIFLFYFILFFLFLFIYLFFFFWKIKKWQIENSKKSEISEILEKLFRVFLFPSFRFCHTAKIENSDLKFLEKNFQDFRGFLVFDMAFLCGDLCVVQCHTLKYFFPRMAFSSVLRAVPKNLFFSPTMVATFCKH